MWNNQKQKTLFSLMSNLHFKLDFQKVHQQQVVNPRHQTPQGQSVAKPGTPL